MIFGLLMIVCVYEFYNLPALNPLTQVRKIWKRPLRAKGKPDEDPVPRTDTCDVDGTYRESALPLFLIISNIRVSV